MASVPRFAMAQREVGLAIGEPPATRGHPPSVFALLPQHLARPGTRTPTRHPAPPHRPPPPPRRSPPSVSALLPKLLERSGTSTRGTITGLYTVLVDGDDMNEPIADGTPAAPDGPGAPRAAL